MNESKKQKIFFINRVYVLDFFRKFYFSSLLIFLFDIKYNQEQKKFVLCKTN